MSSDFAPVPPRPKGWDDLFEITHGLHGIPIEEIERGRVDYEYTFSSNDLRPCGRLGCEQKHCHGWLVALAGGRFVNIGNDCALKYAQAGLWSSSIRNYREQEASRARAVALVEVREQAQGKQYWLDNSPEVDRAIALLQSFSVQARGGLLKELERRAERGHVDIESERRLTDDEVQLRRAMLAGRRTEDEPMPYLPTVERVVVGRIEGLECVKGNGNPERLRMDLQRLVETLLKWSPAQKDRSAQRALLQATRDLAPLSNRLNSSIVAAGRFFTESNLETLMRLEIIRSQGIQSIKLDGVGGVIISRLPHWRQAA